MNDAAVTLGSGDGARRRNVPLERDVFLRTHLGHLSGALQDIIGVDDAAGLVSVVGQRVGDEINEGYRRSLGVEELTRQEVSQVLVDLKRRIQGDFYVIEEDKDRIVLGNRACPFGDPVRGRPALCKMTSNVFGAVTAANLGYARVELEETIAEGHAGCRVVIHLKPGSSDGHGESREYFKP